MYVLTLLFSFTTVSEIKVSRHMEYRFYKNIVSFYITLASCAGRKGEIFLEKIK
jgi:hypothetical protein